MLNISRFSTNCHGNILNIKGNQVIRHKDYRAVCLYRMAYIFLNKDSVSKSDMDSAFNLFVKLLICQTNKVDLTLTISIWQSSAIHA